MPGINATGLVKTFAKRRDFAARVELTPRQHMREQEVLGSPGHPTA
jgi:hypothetical protein